jgi:hypothetical protein
VYLRGATPEFAGPAADSPGASGSLGGGGASVPIDVRTSVLIDALAQPE